MLSNKFLTTIGPPIVNFALNLNLPVEPLIKRTIFRQFCGGESIAECEKVVGELALGNVGTILDYAVEGEEREEVFEATAAEIRRTIQRAESDSRIPLTVFKPTGVARFALLEKVSAKQELTTEEKEEFDHLENRISGICEAAFRARVPVMIDAEESWIQNAIDELALKMMRTYNREEAIVCNTYQLYGTETIETLKRHISLARAQEFKLGAKVVRGAYMEKERDRALERGYPSPIQPDKQATDKAYDTALAFCVENIEHVKIIAGTHNEASCRKLVQCMNVNRISRDDQRIYFSQLLGMGDNLSFNLAAAGYNVAKYVPYGPVKKVMPYLFRRAEENTAIAGQTGRELWLIMKEKERRRGSL